MFTFRKIIFTVCVVLSTIVLVDSNVLRNDASDGDDVDNETVDYYENLINSEMEKAMKFKRPTSAKMHEPNDTQIRDFGSFDFIVIGAGSTGSVIASRLSEILGWRILLLEAGKYPNNFTMIPGFFAVQAMTEYNWGFVSVPQKTACLGAVGKRCVVHRGKGIGGTSLLNQLIYSRGNPIDYDRWSDLLVDPTWRYENVLGYFKKSEDFHKTNQEAPLDWNYHAAGGKWYTSFHMPPNNLTKIFLKANEELGVNVTDYNGKDELGATVLQLNVKNGRRYDQATAFIQPVNSRENLIISPESYVIKIEINNQTKLTTGVLFTKNGKLYRAKANKEVILSAGAVSSPQLLMLSGIGPRAHLQSNNIPVVEDLKVGSSLRDHVFCALQFSTNVTTPHSTLKGLITDYLKGYGDLTAGNPLDAAAWYQTKLDKTPGYPDIEIIPTSFTPSDIGRKFLQWKPETYKELNGKLNKTFSLTIVLLRTRSAGTVRLPSNNPYAYPLIDCNALSDKSDRDIGTMYEGIEMIRKLTRTPTFAKIGLTLETRPLSACSAHEFQSKGFWRCYLRHLSVPAFHPVGTCPSGASPADGAVVDGNLKVFGVGNLRVVDASVIPFTMAGHPNAVCTMIAEKIADEIKFERNVFE
ncbi:unnamed protein product [Phyllotreta striolata]|uniref:Glucose-methanol-choline oxidoreductase N-terminal domain-containing protein n=1 Tax=Phyllotreta striolata TaxID=444603 RepID=A0A9N9TS73_PHYSR|nr:unnamed protein product [Phyllotreta striolata]